MAISASRIRRTSSKSAPSTANVSPFLRKGSAILSNSDSSDMRPPLRASFAYWRSCSMIGSALAVESHSTRVDFLTAARRIGSGVVTMTAPTVPPITIIAAVICVTSATFPPSSTRPPRIPPKAITKPMSVAKSTPEELFPREPPFPSRFMRLALAGNRFLCCCMNPRYAPWAVEDGLPEADHPFNHLVGRLEYEKLLTRCQCNYSIRCDLNMLDQVGVDDQGNMIQASQVNHILLFGRIAAGQC